MKSIETDAGRAMNPARESKEMSDEILISYPLPADNPACQCRDNPMRQMFCSFGHMTECHAPSDCSSARCTHLMKYDEDGRYRGASIIPANDFARTFVRWFEDSPDAGSDCICSYCGEAIMPPADDEDVEFYPPLRFTHNPTGLEIRFHEPCALAALPSVYAMTEPPQTAEGMPKPS